MNMVWHYAPWSRLSEIVKFGGLRGSNTNVPDEIPMLWFSANQQWEPTATKMMGTNPNNLVKLTFKQQAEIMGCIRFGLAEDDQRLLNWKAACTHAGTPREHRRVLERVGKKMGANPLHWFASSVPISMDELHLEVWQGKFWIGPFNPMDAADKFTEIFGPNSLSFATNAF